MTELLEAPGTDTDPAPPRAAGRGRALLGVAPFAAYLLVFLGGPLYFVISGALSDPAGNPTLANVVAAVTEPQYRAAFASSVGLSVVTAVVGAVFGTFLAQAVLTSRPGSPLRRVVSTLGSARLLRRRAAGVRVHRRTRADGSRDAVAARSRARPLRRRLPHRLPHRPRPDLRVLPGAAHGHPHHARLGGPSAAVAGGGGEPGASVWDYWCAIALPVLAPALGGATLVLFGNAFAAYATALALTSGSIPLVPTAIASAVSGNVLAGRQNVGLALGLTMVVVIAVVMVAYLLLQRRASRWAAR
jgi:putative spermidine/putrescine transport system permease protein